MGGSTGEVSRVDIGGEGGGVVLGLGNRGQLGGGQEEYYRQREGVVRSSMGG